MAAPSGNSSTLLGPPMNERKMYIDRRYPGGVDEWIRLMRTTTTLYIGNLSFYTTEEQVHALFSMAGEVRRVIMGLDRFKKTPCGFCFVEYYTREDAEYAKFTINGMHLDDRVVRCDWDGGFKPGRQYGRGFSGGQIRDERRSNYDPGRGGFSPGVDPEKRKRHPSVSPPPPRQERPPEDAGGQDAKRRRVGENPRFRDEENSDEEK